MNNNLMLTAEAPVVQREKRRGRRDKFSPQVSANICVQVASGVPLTRAIESQGVSIKTGFNWRRRHVEFDRSISLAVATYHQRRAQEPVRPTPAPPPMEAAENLPRTTTAATDGY